MYKRQDLYELNELLSSKGALNSRIIHTIVEEGQRVFQRIEDLPVPTVAAIHGMCLGGGAELALACDYRIVSSDRNTKIGWPEVQLGILPAWGGCTRLPEVAGVTTALTAILTGKQYASKPALKSKIVDKIVFREELIDEARDLIQTNKG